MKVVFKYVLLPVAVFLSLVLLTVVVAPLLINVQKLVPRLEKEISEGTGRRFSLGHDLSLSFFPWLSLTFSDLKLGNPPGFAGDHLLEVRSFEARIKVLPLLRNQVEISRFVVGGLSLNLERRADGHGNWEGLFAGNRGQASSTAAQSVMGRLGRLSFTILAVTDGQVRWRDDVSRSEHRLEDIMLLLNDFSPNKAVAIDAKTILDGKPLAMEGKVGPLFGGREGKIALDLGISCLNSLKGKFVGTLSAAGPDPSLVGNFDIPAMPLRDLAGIWGLRLKPTAEGEQPLANFSLRGGLRFNRDELHLENGSGRLDDTAFAYTLNMTRGDTPTEFSLQLNRLDLDRYLPLVSGRGSEEVQEGSAVVKGLLDAKPAGTVEIGRLDYGSIAIDDLHLVMNVKDRRLLLNDVSGKVSGGTLTADLSWAPEGEGPHVAAKLALRQVDSAALLRQWQGQEGVQAAFDADIDLQWNQAASASPLEQLRGEGSINLGVGTLMGSDLTRPASADSNGTEVGSNAPPSTPFSAGQVAMAFEGGVAHIRDASLALANGELHCFGAIDLLQQRLELETATTVNSVVTRRGREEQVSNELFHSITGPIGDPHIADRHDAVARSHIRQSPKLLVAEKLPKPTGDGLGNLVGKDLVDPAVVAERFRLQPEVLQPVEMKKKLPLGEGRIRLGELSQEETLQ